MALGFEGEGGLGGFTGQAVTGSAIEGTGGHVGDFGSENNYAGWVNSYGPKVAGIILGAVASGIIGPTLGILFGSMVAKGLDGKDIAGALGLSEGHANAIDSAIEGSANSDVDSSGGSGNLGANTTNPGGTNNQSSGFTDPNTGVNLPDEVKRLQDDANAIAEQYGIDANEVWDLLLGQQSKYAGIGDDILGGLQDTRTEFNDNIDNMAGLDVTLPGFMGGNTVPLAQNAWMDFYSGKSDTNLRNLATQGNVATQTAGIEQNAISNLHNLANDKVNSGVLTQNLLNKPMDMAMQLLMQDKAGKNAINVSQAGNDVDWLGALISQSPEIIEAIWPSEGG